MSPITTWDGAEAYFTFAHSPTMVAVLAILMLGLTVATVVNAFQHERKSYLAATNGTGGHH
ncbi:hypothetical protein [Zavarzinia sp. CC-PAN008]|uniref:hypothetical protein n=1 Tax=Zavarzinia sp. CC-PAN008 TaxID=3243332 RepID=UPI003F747E6E